MAIDIEKLKEDMRSFNSSHDLCLSCIGIGCLPEHFSMRNQDTQPCPNCNGFRYISKQLDLF